MNEEWGPVWITRLQRREEAAFRRLVDCYERPVFNVAFRILGDAAEAADATQDVFLKVFENVVNYDPKYRLFSWVYKIAMNEALDRAKHHQRTDPVAVPVEDLPLASTERGPDQRTGDSQMHDLIETAILDMPYAYQVVIILRHFCDCSYAQMGEILHLPEKTVKSRLYSARQELRVLLVARGVTA